MQVVHQNGQSAAKVQLFVTGPEVKSAVMPVAGRMPSNAPAADELYLLHTVPLAYTCGCAYFALFKLGNFSFYRMVRLHTFATHTGVLKLITCRGEHVTGFG